MNDEQESVTITVEGIIAAMAALAGSLEGREIMSRAEFAAELRTRSLTALRSLARSFSPCRIISTRQTNAHRDRRRQAGLALKDVSSRAADRSRANAE